MMASTSKTSLPKATCPSCLESRTLKIVGKCNHSFCKDCLSKVLGNLDDKSEQFACPSCQALCRLPWNGVDGLADFGDERAAQGTKPLDPQQLMGVKYVPPVIDTKCQVCLYKKKQIQAVSLCAQCGHLYFCQDCTEIHGMNEATKNHSVTYLQPEVNNDLAICEVHGTELTSYCRNCDAAVCSVCIMLDHGDHKTESLQDKINHTVDELKKKSQNQQQRLTKLRRLENWFNHLNHLISDISTTKQATLIKEVEAQAQKSMEQILKWKEDTKDQVNQTFQVVKDVQKRGQEVSEESQRLQEVTDSVEKLVTQVEYRPDFLRELVAMQQDVDGMKTEEQVDDERDRQVIWKKTFDLRHSDISFIPKTHTSFGQVHVTNVGTCKTFTFSNPKELFHHKVEADSNDMFIPCVSILDNNRFAVAHPTKEGEPSNAIDIYDFSGILLNTLTEDVAPVYDICSTNDGKLAVLSDGTSHKKCSVKDFDPETGLMGASCDIEIAKPISVSSYRGNYCIFGENEEGEKVCCWTNTRTVKIIKISGATRLKVSVPHVVVLGDKWAIIHDIVLSEYERRLDLNVQRGMFGDISFTMWGFVALAACIVEGRLFLRTYSAKPDTPGFQWNAAEDKTVCRKVTGADRECRISVQENVGYLVLSYGCNIKVYAL